jgi:hypothetical protein
VRIDIGAVGEGIDEADGVVDANSEQWMLGEVHAEAVQIKRA